MKALYLIRHAKSSWKDPELSDKDRPLNKRGRKDLPLMARVLMENRIFPDLIISSDAVRARQTAIGLCEKARWPVADIQYDSDLYHASLVLLLEKIYQVKQTVQSLLLFGHNPGFTELGNRLSGKELENVATCGFVAMHFDTDKWENINPSNLAYYNCIDCGCCYYR